MTSWSDAHVILVDGRVLATPPESVTAVLLDVLPFDSVQVPYTVAPAAGAWAWSCTVTAAVILYLLAIGSVRGFALTLGLATLVGRFLLIVPVLALAGSLAVKKTIPQSAGSFPVSGPTFVFLLIGTVLIVGALTFFPAISLGPIVEHFLMINSQKLF